MPGNEFESKTRSPAADAIAPDGSEVRVLCNTSRGGVAEFSLSPGAVSRAIVHRTVDEIWYVLQGAGRMWQGRAGHDEILTLTPGVCLSIPVGVRFQFRCDGSEALVVLGVTMPPWPGSDEAVFVEGVWPPSGL